MKTQERNKWQVLFLEHLFFAKEKWSKTRANLTGDQVLVSAIHFHFSLKWYGYSTAERVKNKLMCRKPKRSKMCSMHTERKFFPGWCEFGCFQQQHKCQVVGVFPRGLGTHHIPYKCRLLSETRFSCCFAQHVHILDWA